MGSAGVSRITAEDTIVKTFNLPVAQGTSICWQWISAAHSLFGDMMSWSGPTL